MRVIACLNLLICVCMLVKAYVQALVLSLFVYVCGRGYTFVCVGCMVVICGIAVCARVCVCVCVCVCVPVYACVSACARTRCQIVLGG